MRKFTNFELRTQSHSKFPTLGSLQCSRGDKLHKEISINNLETVITNQCKIIFNSINKSHELKGMALLLNSICYLLSMEHSAILLFL